jgi:hypothetical protein
LSRSEEDILQALVIDELHTWSLAGMKKIGWLLHGAILYLPVPFLSGFLLVKRESVGQYYYSKWTDTSK